MKKSAWRMINKWMTVALIASLLLAQIPFPAFAAELAKEIVPEEMPLGLGEGALPSTLNADFGKDSKDVSLPTESNDLNIKDEALPTPTTLEGKPKAQTQRAKTQKTSSASQETAVSPKNSAPAASTANKRKVKNLALRQLKQMAKAVDPRDGISTDWVQEMMNQNALASPEIRRLRDAAENLGFARVALNRQIIALHSNQYTHRVPDGIITDQAQSGRCWIFAGLNAIRSTLLTEKRLPNDFEFSENYLYFFSMLEQSNHYLEKTFKAALAQMAGTTTSQQKFRKAVALTDKVGDGGWFNWFQFLVSKYGLIPKRAMAESASSQATALLGSELNSSLAIYTAELMSLMSQKSSENMIKKAAEAKARAIERVWKILSTHLGTPPAHFDFRYQDDQKAQTASLLKVISTHLKTPSAGTDSNKNPQESRQVGAQVIPVNIAHYTPQEFANNFIGFDPNDYVTIGNFERKKDGALYEVNNSAIGASKPGEPSFNIRFIQAGAERMAELVTASIDAGEPVWFGAQAGREMDNETGIMHPNIYDKTPLYDFSKAEKKETLSRNDATYLQVRALNHAMAITGYDRPDPKSPVVKFRVENSWGIKAGTSGIYHMYLEWFNDNVYQAVVHKKFLNEAEKKAWAGKALKLKDPDEM